MSSGKKGTNVWKRIFDLWASIVKMVQNGARSPEWLADHLQKMVDEPARRFALVRHPLQNECGGRIGGFDLLDYLHGFIDYKRISFEDEVVKGWLYKPDTYPEVYKSLTVCLWGSVMGLGDERYVICLQWSDNLDGGCVIQFRRLLRDTFRNDHPALFEIP